ncbi:MAG: LAGLIDADG family homing endonuclease, partial [Aestuariivirga sp.]
MDQNPSLPLDPIAHEIWDMKYRLKALDGTPVDQTPEESWWRVARAVAGAEAKPDRERWAKAFHGILADYRYLPAGRILAGAGSERAVTLFNCFVMGTIPDSLPGIFQGLQEAALTMQQGGGIGHDFSTLRPKGAPVKGVGADASGPLSFMDVWDSMCRTIMSAGTRRGAMMGTMACDHPDIESFIAAKRDAGRLRNFNLSVLVSDRFMAAVKADGDWPLVFGGKTYRVLRARALWDQIMRATYDYAEPGVVFIDRVNSENNLAYCETISCTNPCVTADTWIATSEGPRQVCELTGTPFEALAEGRAWPSGPMGFFSNGTKPIIEIATREGYRLRLTHDHRLRRAARLAGSSPSWEWIEAAKLSSGDSVLTHDHRESLDWGVRERRLEDEGEGYLLGLLIGDGVLKKDKAVLSVWPGARAVNGTEERPGVRGVMGAVLEAASHLPRRSDFTGWMEISGRGEYRLALGAVKSLALGHGMKPGHKTITATMERRSSAFHIGLLRGLFDSDGSVQGNQSKGVSIRLAQSDIALLCRVQRMLLRLGIASSIYTERRQAGPRALPDGKGSLKNYVIRAQHELVIANGNLAVFAERIGFADTEKAHRLKVALANYRRTLNRESFRATVDTISPAGEAEVFDAAIPGLNAFDANGFWVHNCGEQPLPPYGACLLGSLNLSRFVI